MVVLPLPFGPEEAEDLAALDLQRDVLHDVLVAEALVQALDVDDVVGGWHSLQRHRRPAGPDAACSGIGRRRPRLDQEHELARALSLL